MINESRRDTTTMVAVPWGHISRWPSAWAPPHCPLGETSWHHLWMWACPQASGQGRAPWEMGRVHLVFQNIQKTWDALMNPEQPNAGAVVLQSLLHRLCLVPAISLRPFFRCCLFFRRGFLLLAAPRIVLTISSWAVTGFIFVESGSRCPANTTVLSIQKTKKSGLTSQQFDYSGHVWNVSS